MWYRMKLAAADAGKLPVVRDATLIEGPTLEGVLSELAIHVASACDILRGTECPFLEGLLSGGFEIQVWASYESCSEFARAAEGFLHQMRQSVLAAHSSGRS
jgi:hypothetical protein